MTKTKLFNGASIACLSFILLPFAGLAQAPTPPLVNIGIFTTGMLALYLCWVNPALLARLPDRPWFAPLRFRPTEATNAGEQAAMAPA